MRCEFGTSHSTSEPWRPGTRIPCPTPARCAGEGVDWWHLWGTPTKWDEGDERMKPCSEEDGGAYVTYLVGPGPGTNRLGETPLQMDILPGLKEETKHLKWLGSFDHHPSDAEIEALKPKGFQDEEDTDDDDPEA